MHFEEYEIPDQDRIIQLRHELHQHPELSGQETETAQRIIKALMHYKPDVIYTSLGGAGVAAVFKGESDAGPTLLFRAELDALPIPETNSIPYKSTDPNKGHKCGHDGHMAILIALASLLYRKKPNTGKIVLLFQPAEETGQGAWAVLQDERFLNLQPDYVFALHNLPGYSLHQVVVKKDVFSAASTGMIFELQGRESHAAEPENGHNPGIAMAELIMALNAITETNSFEDLALLTVVHARLGEIAFGTNPGYATVMATLRAFQPTDFNLLKNLCLKEAKRIAEKHRLKLSVKFVEEFPATVNDSTAVKLITEAAHYLKLETKEAVQPFKWSEDFGHLTERYPGALFGLGAGTDQAQLHHTDYDFPDELIKTGSSLFYRIATSILNR